MSDRYGAGWMLTLCMMTLAVATFSVSAYCNDTRAADDPLYGIMASGVRTFDGAVACGPGLPFGTLFYIPGYGWAVCADRGGKIGDSNLDLWMETEAQAMKWGRQSLSVLILRGD